MSITQSYFLAHSARGKLSKEASRSDHDLRLLVGHANLLDSLMVDLANAEQEQERWFNQSVNKVEEQRAQKVDTIVEDEAEDEEEVEEDSDDESDYDEEEIRSIRQVSNATITTTEIEIEEPEFEDDEEDNLDLTLTRSPSRHAAPELSSDSESDSDDEPMPRSPPQISYDAFTEKQRQSIATTSFYDKKQPSLQSQQRALVQDGFYLPERQQQPMIAAF